jgi:hypothetical protein
MKNLIKIIGLASLTLFACEKVVDIDVPFEQSKLVVNSILNPDSIFSLHISKSQYILDNTALEIIQDAKVKVFEGNELIGEPLHTQNGIYKLEGVKPEIGKTYTITAERAGMKKAQAMQKVLPKIETVNGKVDTLRDYGYGLDVSFEINLQDPAASKNYYMIRIYSEDIWYDYREYQEGQQNEPKKVPYWSPLSLESPDPSLERVCFSDCGFLVNDEFFDGKSYKLKFTAYASNYNHENPEEDQVERNLYLALYHISESAYLYIVQVS